MVIERQSPLQLLDWPVVAEIDRGALFRRMRRCDRIVPRHGCFDDGSARIIN